MARAKRIRLQELAGASPSQPAGHLRLATCDMRHTSHPQLAQGCDGISQEGRLLRRRPSSPHAQRV